MLMSYISLPASSKVWVYPSSRKFYANECNKIEKKVQEFISNWKVGDPDFRASYRFLYNRFIVIVADDEKSQLQNKDLDKVVSFIFELQSEYNVELLDRMNVCFKQGEYVQYKEVKEFKKLLKNKSVSNKTIVFDNLIQTKEELENFWEIPITESWYSRFL